MVNCISQELKGGTRRDACDPEEKTTAPRHKTDERERQGVFLRADPRVQDY